MKKKSQNKIQATSPHNTNKYAKKEDLNDALQSDGKAVDIKKPKKSKGIVQIKHKIVLDNLRKKAGKGRKPTMMEAMIESGYSEAYARSGTIKKKKSWNQLIEQYLPDELLSESHNNLLVSKRLDYMLFTSEIEDEDIYVLLQSVNCTVKKIVHGVQGTHVWFWNPDGKLRKDAIELAYKIKGKMSPEKFEVEQTGLHALSDAELAELIKKQKNKFLKKD